LKPRIERGLEGKGGGGPGKGEKGEKKYSHGSITIAEVTDPWGGVRGGGNVGEGLYGQLDRRKFPGARTARGPWGGGDGETLGINRRSPDSERAAGPTGTIHQVKKEYREMKVYSVKKEGGCFFNREGNSR